MLSSVHHFVTGMSESFAADLQSEPAEPAPGDNVNPSLLDAFGQCVSLYQSNKFLLTELKSLDRRLSSTQSYLESPGCNPLLARAHLRQLKTRRSAVLTLLRANRLQARLLLARTEGQPDPS